MARLSIPQHDGSLFTWKDNTATAEASALQHANGRQLHAHVYDDACDMGFHMKSPRTGRVKLFTLSRIIRTGQRDITGWEYVGCSDSGVWDLTVTVFND